MQIFDSINVLGYLGEKIAVNILKYLETNRELLNDPLFDCAYRIARASFVKKYFGNVSLDIVANPFRFKLDSIKLDSSEMENSKKERTEITTAKAPHQRGL